MNFSDLIFQWEQSARRAFYDAEHEKEPMGKRLLEHGAMCYFNCARKLREALASVSPQSSTIQEEGQK